MAALLLLPAGTLNYWQAWVFMSVFLSASAVVTVSLGAIDISPLVDDWRVSPVSMEGTALHGIYEARTPIDGTRVWYPCH